MNREGSLVWLWCRTSAKDWAVRCAVSWRNTWEQLTVGDAENLFRNLSSNRMTKASVSLPWCSCVPSVNLIYCSSLDFCSQVSPTATLVIMEQQLLCQEPRASTALVAVSVGSWDANTLPGSVIAIQGFPHISCGGIIMSPWTPLWSCPVILPLFHMLTFWEGALCDCC